MHIALEKSLRLSTIEIFSSPFSYFTSAVALDDELSTNLLAWLEADAPWKLIQADFYEQYEVSLWDVCFPPHLRVLLNTEFIESLRMRLTTLFHRTLGNRVDVTAHKLVCGQRIRLHNDFLSGRETHRLLIQLNRGWKDEYGGLQILFNSSDPTDIHKIFRPIHNSALSFGISPKSNHAVSTVYNGERFTLVYSFYRDN